MYEQCWTKELRKAHQDNDKAVMESYGFDWRGMSESECVSKLMDMYLEITRKYNWFIAIVDV